MNSVGRPQNEYDIEEVDEIIEKKYNSVEGDISKLSYYSVTQFNKYLTEKKFKNNNGNIFRNYGFYFWIGEYKGKINYGKERIDYYKNHKQIHVGGELFEIDTTDIELIIDNNKDDLQTMKRRLVKVFKKERSQNLMNEKQFIQMQKDIVYYKKLVEQYQEALLMLFYNSQYSNNSLNDVITLKKAGDNLIMNELSTIFDNDTSFINYINSQATLTEAKKISNEMDNNIINLASLFSKK